mmetsp:Transcript_16076/g.19551  ORF Transcript_16076/g.19551 Transcript_16076/m.19551 type:complete len:89 (-) Transcript_16076:1547-1813(-)
MIGRNLAGLLGGMSAFGLSLGLVICLGSRGEYSHTATQFGLVALGICLTTAWGAIEAADLNMDVSLGEKKYSRYTIKRRCFRKRDKSK